MRLEEGDQRDSVETGVEMEHVEVSPGLEMAGRREVSRALRLVATQRRAEASQRNLALSWHSARV